MRTLARGTKHTRWRFSKIAPTANQSAWREPDAHDHRPVNTPSTSWPPGANTPASNGAPLAHRRFAVVRGRYAPSSADVDDVIVTHPVAESPRASASSTWMLSLIHISEPTRRTPI